MEHPLIMKVLASSVSLAGRASTIIRNVFASKSLEIVDKGVEDYQSKADRDAQRCIVGSLTHSFPGLKVIGEEGTLDHMDSNVCTDLDTTVLNNTCPSLYKTVSEGDMIVWVDPLDGTKEFTQGLLDYVTVLIGISVKGKPVAGVIAQPFYRPPDSAHDTSPSRTTVHIVWALDGLGLFGLTPKRPAGRLPYPIDPNLPKGEVPNVVITTLSHPSANLSASLEACAATVTIRAGGCGYKVLMLLEGRGHVYLFPSRGTKRWDTCAPEALLNASGGRLTNLLGQPYDYSTVADPFNNLGVLATPVAEWLPIYAKRIPEHVIDCLTK